MHFGAFFFGRIKKKVYFCSVKLLRKFNQKLIKIRRKFNPKNLKKHEKNFINPRPCGIRIHR